MFTDMKSFITFHYSETELPEKYIKQLQNKAAYKETQREERVLS